MFLRRAIKPVYVYGLRLDFGDRFMYHYSNNLTLENSSQISFISTHNLWFRAKKKKNNVYPCKPQFYYVKMGFKGVKII